MSTGFKASEAVEGLQFDLRPYVEVHGVIPEPSTETLSNYMDEVRDLAKSMQELQAKYNKVTNHQSGQPGGIEELSEEEFSALIEEMSDIDLKAQSNHMAGIVARLCGGFPSEENLIALPHRVQTKFFAWIGGAFRPEEGATTTNR